MKMNTPDLNKKGAKQKYAYDYIKHAITVSIYKPGEIIAETDIEAQIPQISRTPIRDAMKSLAYEGFLENVPGQGMRVTELKIDDILANIEFRIPVECGAAKLFISRATNEQYKELENIVLRHKKAYEEGNYEEAVQEDNLFHKQIGAGCGNQLFENCLTALIDQASRSAFYTVNDAERIHLSVNQHEKVLEAIKNKDAELAESLTKEHLVSWSQYIIQVKFKNSVII